MNEEEAYLKGKRDRRAFVDSDNYAQYENNIPVADAMKLFMPNVPQDLMQIQRPLPAMWQAWVNGWKDQSAEENE